MGLIGIAAIMTVLWLIFPKSFKYFVGTWVGAMGGGFFWSLFAMIFAGLITVGCFITFIVVGIIVGCVLAARG